MDEPTRYLANPDVSCREEQPEEGALLFNPDTGALLAINPVGLLIWRALGQPHTRDELAAYVQEVCSDAPGDQVGDDVDEFLQKLLPGGFVGVVLG